MAEHKIKLFHRKLTHLAYVTYDSCIISKYFFLIDCEALIMIKLGIKGVNFLMRIHKKDYLISHFDSKFRLTFFFFLISHRLMCVE